MKALVGNTATTAGETRSLCTMENKEPQFLRHPLHPFRQVSRPAPVTKETLKDITLHCWLSTSYGHNFRSSSHSGLDLPQSTVCLGCGGNLSHRRALTLHTPVAIGRAEFVPYRYRLAHGVGRCHTYYNGHICMSCGEKLKSKRCSHGLNGPQQLRW